MKFEAYCDESHPDLFFSNRPRAQHLMIGSLWLPSEFRNEIKKKVKDVRQRHNTWGEIKWSKISTSHRPFYLDLVDLFESFGVDLRFRCIAVDNSRVDMTLHENDRELGFYKFYYQLLHHWILDFNDYSIFCDVKTNRDPERLEVLRRCLDYANLSSNILSIQSLPSKQVVLIQLCDLLLGAASSRMNNTLREGSAKAEVVKRLESHLGHRLEPTPRSADKFNIFKIRLQGGW